MRLVMWGAGAIGGKHGYFVKAGHDVSFVDVVQEHVDAINQRIRLRYKLERLRLKLECPVGYNFTLC